MQALLAVGEEKEKYSTATGAPYGLEDSEMLPQYAHLYEENEDMVGWIKIDGTVIDYPIMQTKEEPEYYLKRDFSREKSASGVPFLDDSCDPKESNNLLIYGHNMKKGTMFASLLDYAQEDFWKAHPTIQFDTLYREQTYEVVAAFYGKALSPKEEGFRYYEFAGNLDKIRFQEYTEQMKAIALYDTGVEINEEDQLLTLSTCSYQEENGRFVVVARRNKI